MRSRHRFLIATGFVILSGVLSVVAAPELPARMATHWNAAGKPDGTMGKPVALAIGPAMAAVLLVVFAIIPRIGPLRENIATFRPVYDWFVVVFTAFMTVIHGGVIAFNLGYEFDFTLLILAAVAGLFYYVGVLLTHAERNWFVGIRTPWTLSSDVVWSNAAYGIALLGAGATVLAHRRQNGAGYALIGFGILALPLGLPAVYAGYRRTSQPGT